MFYSCLILYFASRQNSLSRYSSSISLRKNRYDSGAVTVVPRSGGVAMPSSGAISRNLPFCISPRSIDIELSMSDATVRWSALMIPAAASSVNIGLRYRRLGGSSAARLFGSWKVVTAGPPSGNECSIFANVRLRPLGMGISVSPPFLSQRGATPAAGGSLCLYSKRNRSPLREISLLESNF